MKAHPAFLALSVLCSGIAATPAQVRAQTPVPAGEVAAPEPSTTLPAPATAPPTTVDTPPPTPVDAPAASAPSPPVAPVSVAPAPAPPLVPPPPLPAPVRSSALLPRRLRDAHHDRVLIVPTANTNPRGSFYGTSYEVVLLQLGYSITDATQISIAAAPPLTADFIVPGDISIKTVLLREPSVSVAVIASATGVVGNEEFSGFLGRGGGAVSFCAEPRECRLEFSYATNLALAGPASVWFNGLGVSWRVGRLVSLLAEVDTVLPLGEEVGEVNGILGGIGVRLSGRAWGVDLALLRTAKAGAVEPAPVVPFLAATYRYLP